MKKKNVINCVYTGNVYLGFAVILLRNYRGVDDVVILLQIQGWPVGASIIFYFFIHFGGITTI